MSLADVENRLGAYEKARRSLGEAFDCARRVRALASAWLRAVLLATLAGCGHELTMEAVADGGPASTRDGGIAAPAEPNLLPCKEGWRESTSAAGVATCEPWPATGREDCAADAAHFPGEGGCVRIGGECPSGRFSSSLPTDAPVIYVLAGVAGGDGSRDRPFGTIGEAMARATSGTVIALGKGRYDEPVQLRAGVTLWGACVGETILAASVVDTFAGTVTVAGPDATVRNLRIEGNRAGLWVDSTSVHVDSVVIDGAQYFGVVAAFGGRISGQRVVIRNTRPLRGRYGTGLIVTSGGAVDLDSAVVLRNTQIGVVATGEGTSLRLRRTVIAGTEPDGDGRFGRGLFVKDGASASLEEAVIEHNREGGVVAGRFDPMAPPRTTVTMSDVVIRETAPRQSDGYLGNGLVVGEGATADVRRALFERNHNIGAFAHHADATLLLEDVVMSALAGVPLDGEGGFGLVVEAGATAHMNRGVLDDNRFTAILVRGAGSRADLSDVVVRGTRSDPVHGDHGNAVEASSGATVEVIRAAFEHNREAAVVSFGHGTTIRMSHVAVADTLERECATTLCEGVGAGFGVAAVQDGAVTLDHFFLARSALCGLQVAGGQLDVSDGDIVENPVGACVQTEGYDVSRLTDGVRYRGNDVNMDTTDLPVPEPAPLELGAL